MTDSLTRANPTPRDLAARPKPPAAPAPVVPPEHEGGFERQWWERALLAAELPRQEARLLGWGLAHLASKTGYLPSGSAQSGQLSRALHLTRRQIQWSLQQLEEAGLITRPDTGQSVRAIALTLLAAPTAPAEPPETGAPE